MNIFDYHAESCNGRMCESKEMLLLAGERASDVEAINHLAFINTCLPSASMEGEDRRHTPARPASFRLFACILI